MKTVERSQNTSRTVCITDARRRQHEERKSHQTDSNTGFARLAMSVLRQAIDDAVEGCPIDREGLRPWASAAGVPFVQIEESLERAWMNLPAA